MLISVDKRLVLFSMPKCGSSALQAALGPHFGAVFAGPARMKHTPFHKYNKFLKPYLATFSDQPFETICLFREPLDWHRSWWRYRQRPRAQRKGTSTAAMSFAAFIEHNLADSHRAARVGNQSRFVTAPDGRVGMDRIFRYENIDACHAYVCERLGVFVPLAQVNVSPPPPAEAPPPPELLARHREAYARDFEIYETVAA